MPSGFAVPHMCRSDLSAHVCNSLCVALRARGFFRGGGESDSPVTSLRECVQHGRVSRVSEREGERANVVVADCVVRSTFRTRLESVGERGRKAYPAKLLLACPFVAPTDN